MKEYIKDNVLGILITVDMIVAMIEIEYFSNIHIKDEKTIDTLNKEIIELKKENKELDDLYQSTYSILIDEGLVGE